MKWERNREELTVHGVFHCEPCLLEHSPTWRIIRVIPGKNYQLWHGPHLVGSYESADECKALLKSET